METDKAVQTMIDNLLKNTGKSLDQWITIVKSQQFVKHGEMIRFLKEEHGLSHGFANLVAHKAKGSDAGSAAQPDDLIAEQYKGREQLKAIYDMLMAEISRFGNDIEVAPKKAYVSLRRKKQFALLNPATKTRFEIGINLKGQEERGQLLAEKPNAMCSHKIIISSTDDINQEVYDWLKLAYEKAV